jgi:hypothetical protein
VPEPTRQRLTKKQRVLDFIAERGWTAIGEAEWFELEAALPDISETTLRECGIPIEAPWSGVNTHSLDQLEACLAELSRVYASRAELQHYCRHQVIAAKDRARWVSKSVNVDEARRSMKAEMVEWMLVWLDDPALFPAWVQLRRQNMG